MQAVGQSEAIHSTFKSLVVALPNRSALAARYLADTEEGGLFIPGEVSLPVGKRVWLDIALARELLTIQCPAQVRWRRLRGQRGLPAGCGLQFELSVASCLRLRRFILAGSEPLVPRARRFHVHLHARLIISHEKFGATVTNLSRSGVLIETVARPLVGKSVQLCLADMPTVYFTAQMARHAVGGIGLRFAPVDFEEARSWRQVVEAAQQASEC